MQLFKSPIHTSVGLDIGSSSIKVAKLRQLKDSLELSGFDFVPFASAEELASALKSLKESQKINEAVIGVSGSATMLRYVMFPKMTPPELRQAMKFEAQKHVPFSLAESVFDASILKDDLPDNKMLVLLAVVKKDYLNQRLKVVQDAGIHPAVVDVDSLAVANAFNYSCQHDDTFKYFRTIALVNIGSALSSVNIVEDGILRLSRDVAIGGQVCTQKIADALGCDLKSAEKQKVAPDSDKAAKVKSVCDALLTTLAAELRTSFDFYESQSASSVTKIFLSGGGSRFVGIKESLSGLLGIEVDTWDPFKRILIAPDLEAQKVTELAYQFPIAVGLALR